MDCRTPRRIYVTFADAQEGMMNIDYEPEEDTLGGVIDEDLAYGLGISAVDFFMGALSRLGDGGSDYAAQFTEAFVRELVSSKLVIYHETIPDDNEEDQDGEPSP